MPAVSPALPPARRDWLIAAGLVLAALAAYHNSFRVPFLFDDRPAIERNASIRDLGALAEVLSPPVTSAGAAGRPLVNLSLALNYAVGGLNPWGYHVFNWIVHMLAGLALWGVVRRTLRRGAASGHAEFVAAGTALLWLVHPLQTESVVCVVQRNEAMVALFFLLTFLAFLRAAEAERPGRWMSVAFVACLAGMATKEVMATAPVLLFLFDRTFVSGSFAAAWRRHGRRHLALAATWLLLAALMLRHEQRAGTVGFGLGVDALDYLLTQARAVALYLKLALWPHPLVLDYGVDVVSGFADVAAEISLVAALLGGTIVALVKRPALGFAGAWFFAILAPSSSFVPLTTQTIAEHRMYLPLAGVLVLAVHALAPIARRPRVLALGALAAALLTLTVRRNDDYRSELAVWTDTVANRPANARAHSSLGLALVQLKRWEDARASYVTAVRLRPDYADAQNDYANVLLQLGRRDEALAAYQAALRLKPADATIALNLATLHAQRGDAAFDDNRLVDAAREYTAALQLRAAWPAVRHNLALALVRLGRAREAIPHYEAVLRDLPESAQAHHNFALALAATGQVYEAIAQDRIALRLQPEFPDASAHLARLLRR